MDMQRALEEQIARILEEAEKPMTAEEIVPHLDPILPTPTDVAEALRELSRRLPIERDGSYYRRPAAVPIASLFAEPLREDAQQVVELIRTLDRKSGHGARLPVLVNAAERRGLSRDRVLDIVAKLTIEGEAYSIGGDRLRMAKN